MDIVKQDISLDLSLEDQLRNQRKMTVTDSELMHHLNGSRGMINALKFHPMLDKLISGGSDGTVLMWNLNTNSKSKPARNICLSFQGHSGAVNDIDISSGGENILSCSADKTLRLFTTKSNGAVMKWDAHSSSVRSCSFCPVNENLIATCSNDQSIKLWALERIGIRQLKPMFKSSYTQHNHWVNSVRFSPDGQLICSASEDKFVYVMDLRVKEPVSHRYLDSVPTKVEFNPGPGAGHYLAMSTASGSLLITDTRMERLKNENELQVIQLYEAIHKTNMSDFVTHCSGDYIFSVGTDAQIKVMDIVEGRRILTYFGHKESLRAVASSDDGKFIATGGEGKEILVWRHCIKSFI